MHDEQAEQVKVQSERVTLDGDLVVPEGARGVVVFAHGSGSSRRSPRNRLVAEAVQAGGLATLLLDLLTRDEELRDERTAELRFDVALLARRLIGAVDWLTQQPATRALRVGAFGASTGAAAALVAAAERPDVIGAVVSRGGRPDLAGGALRRVHAPTLLIVGGNDPQVAALNQRALAELAGDRELKVVAGAGHLFEEPGALDQVGQLARAWLEQHLVPLRSTLPAGEPVSSG
jgi:dienelactone hydrolase